MRSFVSGVGASLVTPSGLNPTVSTNAAVQPPRQVPRPPSAQVSSEIPARKGWPSAAKVALLVVVAVVGGVGYWWMNRPEPPRRIDTNGLYVVVTEKEGKFGFVDANGTVVIEPAFSGALQFSEGLAAVYQDGKWGYVDTKGVLKIPVQFDAATIFEDGLARVCLRSSSSGSQCGFISADGHYVINPQFEDAHPFKQGLASVRAQGFWGFVDKRGKFVIQPSFSNAGDFVSGLAPVAQNGRWGFIDRSGKFVINPQFEGAYTFPKDWPRYERVGNGDLSTRAANSSSTLSFRKRVPSSTGLRWCALLTTQPRLTRTASSC